MSHGRLVEPALDCIRLERGYEIDFWTRRLGASERELRYAVGAVGSDPEIVTRFLRRGY